MRSARHATRCPGLVAGLLIGGLLQAACCQGQTTEERDPTGGLRKRGMVPGIKDSSSSREELARQWDLDGNGTIDQSEASIARARMRRARTQFELDNAIDPVTGKPKVLGGEPEDEEPADVTTPEPDEPRRRADGAGSPAVSGAPRLPGAPALPGAPQPPAGRPSLAGSGTTAGAKPGDSKPGDATPAAVSPRPWSPSWRPASATGGVRAGAPAARAGYGATGPKPDLNAGMPKPILGGRTADGPRGGLLPAPRMPAQRPTTPTAPTSRPPRVSADDIGGF
ncbi:MAG: hypothetical protein ACKO4T_04595 [Planctomycetaceae bacterium]